MTLRSFQASLLDNSLERNSIIYLPTGTGKTRIAICAMYYYLSLYGEEKKIVFLANTIQLVKQQAEAIKQTFTGILQDKNFAAEIRQRLGSKYNELNWTAKDVANKITCIHGERNDDQTVTKRKRIETYMNSRKEFLNEMKKATITVMISQMFLNCLRRGYIKITDYSFVVFDECHHCDGDHPFSGIMKEFYFEQKRKNKRLEANNQPDDKNKLPYMMGLTASPVSQPYNDHAKLTKELRRLCINLDSNYASYPQGENLTNQTEIYIEKIVE
jgi:endoribonuclease Dicer